MYINCIWKVESRHTGETDAFQGRRQGQRQALKSRVEVLLHEVGGKEPLVS